MASAQNIIYPPPMLDKDGEVNDAVYAIGFCESRKYCSVMAIERAIFEWTHRTAKAGLLPGPFFDSGPLILMYYREDKSSFMYFQRFTVEPFSDAKVDFFAEGEVSNGCSIMSIDIGYPKDYHIEAVKMFTMSP